MFGHGYFGAGYFGPGYFGPGGGSPVPAVVYIVRAGDDRKRKKTKKKKKPALVPLVVAPTPYKPPPVDYKALNDLETQLIAAKRKIDALKAQEIARQGRQLRYEARVKEELRLKREKEEKIREAIRQRDAQDEEDILTLLEFI